MRTTWRKRVAAALTVALCLVAPASAQGVTDAEFRKLLQLAEAGNVPAMDLVGQVYLDPGPRRNPAEGLRWLKAAADKGHAPAALRVAIGTGEGDFDRAYLQKAADGGLVYAVTLLGSTHTTRGNLDYPQAARLFREAADRGSAEGAFLLGRLHAFGRGARADAVESDRLIRVAAALDWPAAKTWLADPAARYGEFTPEQAAAANARAEQALARSKAKGFVNATVADVARVRHTASGLTCDIAADALDVQIEDGRDGAVCREAGVEYRARPARPDTTADRELQAWVAETLKTDKRRKPVESPTPDSPGSRFPEAWLGDGETDLRLSVGVVDGWVFSERINASADTWRRGTGGGRAYAPLNLAAPLPAVRPAISVIERPRPSKDIDDGPPPNVEMIRALVAACVPQGAYGERFGATTVTGVSRPRIGNSWEVRPSPDIPGVRHVEVVVTNNSGRIHSLNAWSPGFRDKAELRAGVAAGRTEALRLGWTQTDGSEAEQNYVFARRGADGAPMLELEVGEVLGSLVVTCRDPALFALTWREFTGNERPAERPSPPVVPPGPPRLWSTDCLDPGMRRVIVKAAYDESRVRMGLGAQWDRYYEALARWKVGVISEKARLTKAQTSDLGIRTALGGMKDGFEQSLASFSRGVDGLLAMDKALERGDEQEACREATIWLDATEDIVKGNRSQWVTMHRLLDAEAAKRGVSFD